MRSYVVIDRMNVILKFCFYPGEWLGRECLRYCNSSSYCLDWDGCVVVGGSENPLAMVVPLLMPMNE